MKDGVSTNYGCIGHFKFVWKVVLVKVIFEYTIFENNFGSVAWSLFSNIFSLAKIE